MAENAQKSGSKTKANNFTVTKSVPKNWLINNFEEIGWMDPEFEDYTNYKG